jgi:hypothetical protein
VNTRQAWAARFTIKARAYGSYRWSAYDAATGAGPLEFPAMCRDIPTYQAFFPRKRDVLAAIDAAWERAEYRAALAVWEGEGGAA